MHGALTNLRFPRDITYGNEFGKKGVRIPSRGATARRRVQDIRSRRNVINNGVRSGSSGRKGRRNWDSRREGDGRTPLSRRILVNTTEDQISSNN